MLSHKLAITKDLLTSRAGLVSVAQLMQTIGFEQIVDQHFPLPKSNRGFKPSTFVQSFMLMFLEGGQCLEDLQYIRQDQALRLLLGINKVPESDSAGDWLRRLGQVGVSAVVEVNRTLLKLSLNNIKSITLDIDATLAAANKKSAYWSYKKCKGYMPMVGTIAEVGQIAVTEFREGNVAPSFDNLGFIKRCARSLPEGVKVGALRIDAAGYQADIINYCHANDITFAIRAVMNPSLNKEIKALGESRWHLLLDREGNIVPGASTARMVHTMANTKQAFTLIVQRQSVAGQTVLDLDQSTDQETIRSGKYLYRAIAVSGKVDVTDSHWVNWYNQRGEHSENRIKELKADFAAGKLPCQDFAANSLYFALSALAYNLFALLRMFLPPQFEASRAKQVRLRIFALAAKVVRHGRKIYLKLAKQHHCLLATILQRLSSLCPVT
jgi:hypothetical protein